MSHFVKELIQLSWVRGLNKPLNGLERLLLILAVWFGNQALQEDTGYENDNQMAGPKDWEPPL